MSTAGYVVITTQGGSTVIQVTTTAVVNVLTSGPQGPTGATGPQGPAGSTSLSATAPITYNSGTQTIAINAATQSSAGSMSAADKIKLDNSTGLAAGLAIALG